MIGALAALTYILSTIFAIAGMGAAGVLVPNYIALGLSVYTAITLALAQNIADLAVVTALHTRRGLVDWKKVATVAAPAVMLVPLGVYIAVHTPRIIILVAFGAFLVFALYRLTAPPAPPSGKKSGGIAAALGAAEGVIAGLIGMDAAPIALIAYSYLHNDPKKISANTAATALIVSATAFTTYLYALHTTHGISIGYTAVLLVMAAGAAGGATGAKLVHRVKPVHVRATMIAVLSLALAEIAAKIAKAGLPGEAAAAALIASLAIILAKATKKPTTRPQRIKTLEEAKQQRRTR
ncbi:hypothetical protein PYJP_11940 [Pyrofollis japonicus]|uniref:sulfite exporter TauE/SafE family protein n=1 Tax=Pyrofollis japonicus TaxID=3060460 RepID=UPI00295BC517|nr:sulfite exporter TauE/SafE family protein [Pyrofollis japonicus]BEP17842.1 hypothetical protein PYJP_11940 [Pyrofollis japonicus]